MSKRKWQKRYERQLGQNVHNLPGRFHENHVTLQIAKAISW
jgi:hypothetical protein